MSDSEEFESGAASEVEKGSEEEDDQEEQDEQEDDEEDQSQKDSEEEDQENSQQDEEEDEASENDEKEEASDKSSEDEKNSEDQDEEESGSEDEDDVKIKNKKSKKRQKRKKKTRNVSWSQELKDLEKKDSDEESEDEDSEKEGKKRKTKKIKNLGSSKEHAVDERETPRLVEHDPSIHFSPKKGESIELPRIFSFSDLEDENKIRRIDRNDPLYALMEINFDLDNLTSHLKKTLPTPTENNFDSSAYLSKLDKFIEAEEANMSSPSKTIEKSFRTTKVADACTETVKDQEIQTEHNFSEDEVFERDLNYKYSPLQKYKYPYNEKAAKNIADSQKTQELFKKYGPTLERPPFQPYISQAQPYRNIKDFYRNKSNYQSKRSLTPMRQSGYRQNQLSHIQDEGYEKLEKMEARKEDPENILKAMNVLLKE